MRNCPEISALAFSRSLLPTNLTLFSRLLQLPIPLGVDLRLTPGEHVLRCDVTNAQTRREWISALDKIEALNPRAVVASHKQPENDDNPGIIEQTRQYIRDFERLAETTKTAQELYDKMLELYPSRVNPGWALWSSARAVKS
jgi:hypothetical protein